MLNFSRSCLAATSLLLGLAALAAAAATEIKIGADRRIRITEDWREMNRPLFDALYLETVAIALTIGMIVMVAALKSV